MPRNGGSHKILQNTGSSGLLRKNPFCGCTESLRKRTRIPPGLASAGENTKQTGGTPELGPDTARGPSPSGPRRPQPGRRSHRLPADALDAPPLRGHRRHAQGLVLQGRRPPGPLGAQSPSRRQRLSSRTSRRAELPELRAGCHGNSPALSRLRTAT